MERNQILSAIHSFSSSVLSKLKQLQDIVILREVSPLWQLVEFYIIKYLYVILSLLVLKDMWYPGSGGYGIDFIIWKELVASLVFGAVTCVYLCLRLKNRFIKTLMQILFILYYIPLNCAFALNNASWGFLFQSNLYFVLLIVIVYWLAKLMEGKTRVNKTRKGDRVISAFCFIVCCIFIIHKFSYNGLEFSFTISGESVYETRAGYVEYLSSISGTMFSYLLAIIRNLVSYVAPFYILYGLMHRKPLPVFAGGFCVLCMYAVSSEKSDFMMPLLVLLVYFCYRIKILKRFNRLLPVGMITLMVICLLSHIFFHSDKIFILLIRRIMYIPAWLNKLYFDFFTHNPKLMWSQSVLLLQNILKPVYEMPILTIINNLYFNGAVPSPNTGMFAEAYMQFGIFGVFLYPVLLAGLFLFSKKVYSNYDQTTQTVIAIQLVMGITNIPITRTDFILSYVLFTVILWILPKFEFSNIKRRVNGTVKRHTQLGDWINKLL